MSLNHSQTQSTILAKNDVKINVIKSSSLKAKPDFQQLGFGQYFTDHMFLALYNTKNGWHDFKVTPYAPLQLDPAASVLHYGQALFEGLKAFKQVNGEIALFRTDYNWQRMRAGCERLCMQMPPIEVFQAGIRELIKVDQSWIPENRGSALYIRPTLIGTEGFLGVRPSTEYLFFVILSPVGAYYKTGFKPVSIWVEEKYTRAAPGGLGATKAAANYANSLKAADLAKQKNFAQVLWLDVDKKHVEEVGTMNVFFVFKNEIITPDLGGTILAGGTRDSAIKILRQWGHNVVERKISLAEIRDAAQNGDLKEAFGTGTAAVITSVGELAAETWSCKINDGQMGDITNRLFQDLTDIQYGIKPDINNWIEKLI